MSALVKGKDYRKLSRRDRRFFKERLGKSVKYSTLGLHHAQTEIYLECDIIALDGYVKLTTDGLLIVYSGYCWDGASGPTFDTAATMRASLFHDAGYQLMREGKISVDDYRVLFDAMLMTMMIVDGAWWWRASLWMAGVRFFARYAAKPRHVPGPRASSDP